MPRPITVTYTLHPTTGPQREHLIDALTGIQAQLPLRNLHWKPSTRTALRTIQEVNVRLTDLGELGPQREVGGSVMDGALVNICLVACDDAEIYKNATRSFIRDWLSLLSSRRNVYAPLIVLVNPPTARDTGKNVFGRDKGILGKLKSDFNLPKRDRCAQVNLPSGNVADPAAWPEVMTRLKESIVYAFDAAIMEREEEVKRGEAQRLTVGWNFCTWFLLKESLAHSFEGLSLPEDALLVYEELDATFLQILKENNLSWFGKLGASGARDDSLPILDTAAKPYREMLQQSQISVFDFRIYVFARQAALLGALGRITEVAKRGQWFVASLARRLRESEADLAEHFIESWTYTACMDIVARCDEWSRLDRPNGDYSGLIAYESARSELLDIARVQVERIGVASGHLPDIYPFSPPSGLIPPSDDVLFDNSDAGMSDNGQRDVAKDGLARTGQPGSSRAGPSNAKLAEAVQDADKLRALYTSTTKAALAAYEACGKVNSGIRLKVDLAALAMHEQKWQTGHSLCQALARDCLDLKASRDVLRFALEGVLTSHKRLGLPKDAPWADTATAFLQNETRHQHGRPSAEVEGIIACLRDLDAPYTVEDSACFSASLSSSRARSSSTMSDAIETDVIVTNHLAQIEVDDVEIAFQDADGNDISFRTGAAGLSVGVNSLQANCITSIQGIYQFASASLRIGNTTFKLSQLASRGTLQIRRSAGGLRAELAMPNDLALDQPPKVTLRIMAGAADMSDVQAIVYSMTGDVILDPSRASSGTACTPETSCIRFDSIEGDAAVEVSIPYRGTPVGEVLQCRVRIKYISNADGLSREYVDVQSVFTGLPLTVNVQDFFRPESLTSHFTIASDGREYLRIKSIGLHASDDTDLAIEIPKGSSREMIVTPDRHIASLFKIRQTSSGTQKPNDAAVAVLRLVITYRNMEEEARSRLTRGNTAAVSQALRNRRSWLPDYVATGKIPRSAVAQDSEVKPIDDLPWRTLTIPVEVPSRRLLVSARISRSTTSTAYEGHALAVQLDLRAHYTWTGQGAGEHELSFDVQPDPEEWIVLGRKKGTFAVSRASADESEVHTSQLTLVPMRPGSLALPNVAVSIIPRAGPHDPSQLLICETFVENAAEAIRVLPATKAMSAIVPVFPPRPTSLQQSHWDDIAV